MLKKSLYFTSIVSLSMLSSEVLAHANILDITASQPLPGRAYVEGKTASLKINIGHACSRTDGKPGRLATLFVAALLPTGEAINGVTYMTDTATKNKVPVAPMRGIRAEPHPSFETLAWLKDQVPPYPSESGPVTEGVLAYRWKDGWLPDEHYADLAVRGTLANLDGCVSKLRVYVPVVQYCEEKRKYAWIREPTGYFSKDDISPGYAAYFDIVRDTKANPLPASCNGKGDDTKEYYPSAVAIDSYLSLEPLMILSNTPRGMKGSPISATLTREKRHG